MSTHELLVKAQGAKRAMAAASEARKNQALLAMADALQAHMEEILAANEADMAAARGSISEVMLDRLSLNESRIQGMAEGIRDVAALPDPCGRILSETTRPNGLRIRKVSVPMGVIAIIYESRPNVTSDAAALAVKAGSACVLRSGKEAHRSAEAIVNALREGLLEAGLPADAVVLVEDITRASSEELMTARGFVDLLIPRGGKGLIRACVDNAKVPVLETGTGICHIFVDKTADLSESLRILENAKCSRPSVCNAMEVCLIHEEIAPALLPELVKKLGPERDNAGKPAVRFRLDEKAWALLTASGTPSADPEVLNVCISPAGSDDLKAYISPAGPEDFDTEFLDYVLTVRIVSGVDEAIDHIAVHSTGHSEAILTRDSAAAARFTSSVDSAAVYVNASTRFTDGGEFGLGCEMGISTQKMHARGPMGLEELCSYKYIIEGDGQIR